jgi:hypothetical protein
MNSDNVKIKLKEKIDFYLSSIAAYFLRTDYISILCFRVL